MGAAKYILIFLLIAFDLVFCDTNLRRSGFDEDYYESVLDSVECSRQLTFLRNNSLGLQFLDASAKLPSGMLTGNWNDLGDYFQCLGIDQLLEDMHIEGKYCTVTVPLQRDIVQIPEIPDWPQWPQIPWPQPDNETLESAMNVFAIRNYAHQISGVGDPIDARIFPITIAAQLRMKLAVCIPKVCSTRQAVDFVQEQIPFINVTYDEYFCRLPNDKPYVAADIVALSLFSLIGFLLVASTIYDLCQVFILKKDTSRINPLFRSFSIYTNTRRILTFNSAPGALECVDGIRAISMMWVIVGHTYSMTLLGFIHNMNDTISWLTDFSSTWINSAPITVDTFFMLSGILAVYTTVGKISGSRFAKTIHLFIINRLLRMFPLLAAVVLLQASFFNHVSDGPFWQNVAHATENLQSCNANCRTYWWSTLLHVQNYVNPLNVCLAQTWYLSVDVQLYVICPIILIFLFGRETFAWSALTFAVVLSLVGSTTYSFLYGFSAALANLSRLVEFNEYVRIYYMNTLTRASPFFVGMMYGYLLHLCRNKKIHISYANVTILWALSFLMMAFCIFSIYPVMQLDHSTQIFDNFLNSYMRAIWAVGLGWLIFACVHGYGGPINWFLSLEMWKLPARLSYGMYLIHLPIIMIANGSWVKTYYFSNGSSIYRFMGDISLSFLASFILSIVIDAPFSTLQKLLLGGGGKRPEKPKSESRENIVDDVEDRYIKTTL